MRSVRTAAVFLTLAAATAAGAGATIAPSSDAQARPTAKRSTAMLLGVMDDAMLLYRTNDAFDSLAQLSPQIIRFDADWPLIAKRRPSNARNPDDPAYDFRKTDEIVKRADEQGIQMLLTIGHTPQWAGGTKRHNRAP